MATQSSFGLEPGRIYSWDELARIFQFRPGYFAVAGGMVVSSATNSLLLITHPGGGKTFDYGDYWDGADLIYTGRGKIGDQQATAQNLDVIEDRRRLFVFEAAGSQSLLFRGVARRSKTRIARAPDDNGDMRNVFQFRLVFDMGPSHTPTRGRPTTTEPPDRRSRPRPFREERPPPPPPTSSDPANPEETAAKREQADERHHAILVTLSRSLAALGCASIEELPGAIDLWATSPDGRRVIFEAKTLSGDNELSQTRSGFAQLAEYRLEHGTANDELCLVVDRPLTVRRQKLLDSLDVAVLVRSGADVDAGNDLGSHLIDALTS